jgi:hypothetical protein
MEQQFPMSILMLVLRGLVFYPLATGQTSHNNSFSGIFPHNPLKV